MTQWWLFPGSSPPITIYTARDQSLGAIGSPGDRRGTSASPRWRCPSLVVAGLSSESEKGLCLSAAIGCFWVIPILSVAFPVLAVLLDPLKCPGTSQGSPMPDTQSTIFVTGWSVLQPISEASRSSLKLESTELHSSQFPRTTADSFLFLDFFKNFFGDFFFFPFGDFGNEGEIIVALIFRLITTCRELGTLFRID